MIRMHVRERGAVYDEAQYTEIVDDMRNGILDELAIVGEVGVRRKLLSPWPAGIRERTPYLETKIQRETPRPFVRRVHNGDVVYRHWIEGTGSRNRARPGFPGYHAFEDGYGRVLDAQDATEQRHLRLAVARLNG